MSSSRPAVNVYYVPSVAKPPAAPPPSVVVDEPPPPPPREPSPPPVQQPSAAELFRPLVDSGVTVAGWNRRKDDILPMNIEEEPDARRREELFEELAKREAIIHADLVYNFVKLVAGITDQKMGADAYWEGVAQGGSAVEAAFSNLFRERPEQSQGPLFDEEKQKEIADKMAEALFGKNGKDDRALDLERLSALGGIEGLPLRGRQLAEAIEYAKELKELAEALNLGKGGAGGLSLPAGAAAGSGGLVRPSVDFGSALGGMQRTYPADYTEYLRTPAFAAEVERQRRVQPNNDAANRAAWDSVGRALFSAAAPPPAVGGTAAASETATVAAEKPKTFALKVDGKYYDHMENGKAVLARLMLSKGFSEMQWRAWDVLYNQGRYTEAALRGRGGNNGSRSFDPNDPVQLEKALRARREILRMFKENRASRQWRRAPENLGTVFLTPKFSAALEKAFGDVNNVAMRQHIPLIDLMTHQNVRIYFAWLVAFSMAGAQALFAPTRVMVGGQVTNMESARQRLLGLFSKLDYVAGPYLGFSGITDPFQIEIRKSTEAERARSFRVTGAYHSELAGPPPAGALKRDKPFKKPRVEVDPRIEATQQARIRLMTGSK